MRDLKTVMLFGMVAFAVACAGGEAPAPEADMDMEEEMTEAAPEPTSQPRVFFVAPEDGAEISVDIGIHFEFGAENFEVSPVPEEVESPREEMGHYHLGVNSDCLPAGEIIEQGTQSWIHFGDGSNIYHHLDEPGRHTFALQMADDEHRTIEGLCETIEVELADGI